MKIAAFIAFCISVICAYNGSGERNALKKEIWNFCGLLSFFALIGIIIFGL
jgi:hypothetical protein